MPKISTYRSTVIRAEYSRHCLRATLEGFPPLTLHAFVRTAARAYYMA